MHVKVTALNSHEIVSVRKNPKGQARMNNPETLRTQSSRRRQTKQLDKTKTKHNIHKTDKLRPMSNTDRG